MVSPSCSGRQEATHSLESKYRGTLLLLSVRHGEEIAGAYKLVFCIREVGLRAPKRAGLTELEILHLLYAFLVLALMDTKFWFLKFIT